jgi:hypothetical protein
MALPNTRKVATTFTYKGYAFRCSPSLSKMEALEDAVGMDYLKIIDSISGGAMLNPEWSADEAKKLGSEYDVPAIIPDPERPPVTENFTEVLFYTQDNPEQFTRDEIHEFWSADMSETGFGAKAVQEEVTRFLFALKGMDYQEMIAKAAAKKKPTASPARKVRRPTKA